jgi:4-hydroxymandelate synthase
VSRSLPATTPMSGPLVELDVLELWVGDLGQTKRVLTTMFGFEPDETEFKPRPDEETACLTCGNVSLIVRQGTSAANPISRHVAAHGDGVGDVALVCGDVGAVVDRALAHGLKVSNESGCSQIDLLGDGTILHSIRDRRIVSRPDTPGRQSGIQIRAIDHITYCLPWGMMDRAAHAYREVFKLEYVEVKDCAEIGDGVNGMRSTVLRSPLGFTVVLTEPMSSASVGQTQHFVRVHAGAGVQHVAFAYNDLLAAVGALRSNGVPFLPIPEAHLELSHRRLRDRALPWDALWRHGILVDADENGLLFQLFTRPITDRSSFFLELMHRAGATGFGATNVRGLFAAVDAAMRD